MLGAVRPGERRDVASGFSVLFLFVGSHVVLETARDALFLSRIPAARLPWVYILVAVASLALVRAQKRLEQRVGGRRAVTAATGVATVVTLAFWAALPVLGAAGLYGLYVWSGLLATIVLGYFWTLLGDVFSVTQAKRLYGAVGAGSVAGALAGSGLAAVIGRFASARTLVLAAAIGFGLATLATSLLRESGADRAPDAQRRDEIGGGLRTVLGQPYARRIALLFVVATVTVTLADFVFKSVVARTVSPDRLGSTFANIYLGLNVASLFTQLFLVRWVLRRFDVSIALAILPVLLLVGAAGVVATGGLAAALVVKGADGALRHSVHKTASELLFVPLSDVARRRVKSFVDVVAQRGAQGVASACLLVATALGAPPWFVAAALGAFALAWVLGAIDLRRHYVDLFRTQLREGHFAHLGEFPDLDVGSLETLVAALDSPRDAEVVTALDVLEREGRARLVPGLILYHPSERVVVHALALFARANRTAAVPIVDRLLEHGSPLVRSAAVATRAVLAHDERQLRNLLSFEEAAEVRATIVVQLVAAGDISGQEARERLQDLHRHGSAEVHVALSDALGSRRAREHAWVLARLVESPEVEVRRAAVRALGALADPAFVPQLVGMLGDEKARAHVKKTLVSFGDEGLAALERALDDPDLPGRVRWQVPAAIAELDPARAAAALCRALTDARDGSVRYRVIHALEWLTKRDPSVKLDARALEKSIDDTLARAFRYVERRRQLARGAAEVASRKTPGHGLLVRLLSDKLEHAVGRVFRLLGLLHPGDDLPAIRRGLKSKQKSHRASSLELLESLLSGPRRPALVALVDDGDDDERSGAAGPYRSAAVSTDYSTLLEQMLASSSDTLSDLAAFHAGELGLVELRSRLEGMAQTEDVKLALERLAARAEPEVVHAG